jgi:hypothetical protein
MMKRVKNELDKAWAKRLMLYAEAKRFEIDSATVYPAATHLRGQGDMQFANAVAIHCGPDVYITWHSPLNCTVLSCTAAGAMEFSPDELTT